MWKHFMLPGGQKKQARQLHHPSTGTYSLINANYGQTCSLLEQGKWHLGDLWDKKLPNMNKKWPVSSPGNAGEDIFAHSFNTTSTAVLSAV